MHASIWKFAGDPDGRERHGLPEPGSLEDFALRRAIVDGLDA